MDYHCIPTSPLLNQEPNAFDGINIQAVLCGSYRLATEDCFFYTIWSIYGRFLKQTQLIVLDYIHQETITSGYQKWHVYILDSRGQQPHQYCIPAKENAISVKSKVALRLTVWQPAMDEEL